MSRPGLASVELGHSRPSTLVLWRLLVTLELSPTDLVRILGDLVDAPAGEVAGVLDRPPVLDGTRNAPVDGGRPAAAAPLAVS